jgi:hypothetical protein
MSERTLSLLITFGIFLLMAAWIPFLDISVRLCRRHRQSSRTARHRVELKRDLPLIYRFLASPQAEPNPESQTASARAQ